MNNNLLPLNKYTDHLTYIHTGIYIIDHYNSSVRITALHLTQSDHLMI